MIAINQGINIKGMKYFVLSNKGMMKSNTGFDRLLLINKKQTRSIERKKSKLIEFI